MTKLMRILFLISIVCVPGEGTLGQDMEAFKPPVVPSLPANQQNVNTTANGVPKIGDLLTVVDKATAGEAQSRDWSTPVKLVIVFTGLALLPSLLVMMTSFTRIVIVLAFIRRALTTQTIPPTIAIIGLGLFLTMFTMAPTMAKINANSPATHS